MAAGIDSSLRPATYRPLSASYCRSRDPLHRLGVTAEFSSPWDRGRPELAEYISGLGGLVVPFSYASPAVSFTGSRRDPVIHVFGYGPKRPGDRIPDRFEGDSSIRPSAVSMLDGELTLIHREWPDTRIVVMGHSEGGLVAERWWIDDAGSGRLGVVHVYALDSPINGTALDPCVIFMLGGPLCRSLNIGGSLGRYWAGLWHANRTGRLDRNIVSAQKSRIPRFTAVGTRGDELYRLVDSATGGYAAIDSQLVFTHGCPSSGGRGGGRCSVRAGPNLISSCNRSSDSFADVAASHSQVIDCKTVENAVRRILR